LEPLHNRDFGLRTDNTIDLSACVEYEQSRDALNAEPRRRGRILIDIELADAYSPCHLFRYFFDYWRDQASTTALDWSRRTTDNESIVYPFVCFGSFPRVSLTCSCFDLSYLHGRQACESKAAA
jgi:hypothetical protein